MNQQINLYQPIFRRQKKVFSALAMFQICAFFFVVFISLYLYGQIKLAPLKEQTVRLDQDLRTLGAQLTKVQSQRPGETGSRLLENEITRLNNELAKRKQVQNVLSSQSIGNTDGMSGYLEAFARQHLQGMWLTRIAVANGGKRLGLNGKTLSSELVPAYMEQLAGESLLNGMSFNVMELTRPADPSNQLEFYISTN